MYLQWMTNGKSYAAYEMAPITMTLSDLQGHFCCLKLLTLIHREM